MNLFPLHPALVHLPLGLAFVMPLLTLGLGWALWTGRLPRRAWVLVVALQAVLLAAGVVALRSGEAEEDRVERIVAEAVIARHEAAAQQFVWATAAALALAVGVLFLGEGAAVRLGLALTAVAAVGVTGLAVRVGHAGGQLVYVHGAASAYAPPAGSAPSPLAPGSGADRERDDY